MIFSRPKKAINLELRLRIIPALRTWISWNKTNLCIRFWEITNLKQSEKIWPSIENVKKGCYLILDFCLWINFISLLVQRSNEPMNGAKDAFQFYRKKLCLTSPVLTQNWKLCLTFFNAAHGSFKCEPQSCFLNICLKKKIGDSKKWFWACYKKFSSQPHVPKR